MKPDWKGAPEWARYLAQDGDGDWYWYRSRPSICEIFKVWVLGDDRFERQFDLAAQDEHDSDNWMNTLEHIDNET